MMNKFNHSFLKCIIFIAIHSVFAIQCMTLHDAVRQDDLQMVQKLIRDGADIHKLLVEPHTSQLRKPLEVAVCKGRVRIAKLLLKKGASPSYFIVAAHNNDRRIMKLLFEHGIDPNDEPSALCHLIEAGRLKAIKLFFKFGADFQLQSPAFDGMTPLHVAAYRGKANIVKYFLKRGVPIDIPVGLPSRISPLRRIVNPLERDHPTSPFETARLLLSHGANPVVIISGWPTVKIDVLMHIIKLLWAYARALDKEEEFVKKNKSLCDQLVFALQETISDDLEAQTCDARLQLLYRKHNTRNINDLLFKRETGMIRLP